MEHEYKTKEIKIEVLKNEHTEQQVQQQENIPEQMEKESHRKMQIYLQKYTVSKEVAEGLQEKMSGILQEMEEVRKNHAGESEETLERMTRGLQNRYARLEKEMNLQKKRSEEWKEAREELLESYMEELEENAEEETEKEAKEQVRQIVEETEHQVAAEEEKENLQNQISRMQERKTEKENAETVYEKKIDALAEKYAGQKGTFDSSYFKNLGICLAAYQAAVRTKDEAVILKEAAALKEAAEQYNDTHARPRRTKKGRARKDLAGELLRLAEEGMSLINTYRQEMENSETDLQNTAQKLQEHASTGAYMESDRLERERQEQKELEFMKEYRQYREEAKEREKLKAEEETVPEILEDEQTAQVAADTAQDVIELLKNGNLEMTSENLALLQKQGILYSKEKKAGFLYDALKMSNKFEFLSGDAFTGLQELSIDKDGVLCGTMKGGMTFRVTLLKNETNMDLGNGYLGMLASLNSTLLDAGLDVALNTGNLKPGEYGLETKGEIQALIGMLEGRLQFNCMGVKCQLMGGAAVGMGLKGEFKISNQEFLLDLGAHMGLGLTGGVRMNYNVNELGPELYIKYLNEKRKELRKAEEAFKEKYEERQQALEKRVAYATTDDREWWALSGSLDLESQCFLDMVRDSLKNEGIGAETNLELLVNRLKQRYETLEKKISENTLSEDDRNYLMEQSNVLKNQYELFSSEGILEKIKDGSVWQKLREIPGSGYCPQDLQVDTMKAMRLIQSEIGKVDTKKISTHSKPSFEWYGEGKELLTDEEVTAVTEGLSENVQKLDGYQTYADKTELTKMLPDMTEATVDVDYLTKLWKSERPEDLEAYVTAIVDRVTANLEQHVNKDLMLMPYSMNLFVNLDSLISRYRHAEDTDGDGLARKELADQILLTCGKLEYYMEHVEREGKATREHEELEKELKQQEARKKKEEQERIDKAFPRAERRKLRTQLWGLDEESARVLEQAVIHQKVETGEDYDRYYKGDDQENLSKVIQKLENRCRTLEKDLTSVSFWKEDDDLKHTMSRQLEMQKQLLEQMKKISDKGVTEPLIRQIERAYQDMGLIPMRLEEKYFVQTKAYAELTKEEKGEIYQNKYRGNVIWYDTELVKELKEAESNALTEEEKYGEVENLVRSPEQLYEQAQNRTMQVLRRVENLSEKEETPELVKMSLLRPFAMERIQNLVLMQNTYGQYTDQSMKQGEMLRDMIKTSDQLMAYMNEIQKLQEKNNDV